MSGVVVDSGDGVTHIVCISTNDVDGDYILRKKKY